jgi:hypothetical protein
MVARTHDESFESLVPEEDTDDDTDVVVVVDDDDTDSELDLVEGSSTRDACIACLLSTYHPVESPPSGVRMARRKKTPAPSNADETNDGCGRSSSPRVEVLLVEEEEWKEVTGIGVLGKTNTPGVVAVASSSVAFPSSPSLLMLLSSNSLAAKSNKLAADDTDAGCGWVKETLADGIPDTSKCEEEKEASVCT